jgi:hypothetical protein
MDGGPRHGEVAGDRRRKSFFTFSDFYEIRCNVFSYCAVLTVVRLLRCSERQTSPEGVI